MSDSKTRTRKPHREPLPDEWAKALLHFPTGIPEGEGPLRYPPDSVYKLIEVCQNLLRSSVKVARKHLETHPFLDVIAREAARQVGRRGDPYIVLDDDGRLMLEVRYDGATPEMPPKALKKSKLPSMTELRARAQKLGVDISDLGKAKKKIIARLDGTETKPKPKMTKQAPALAVRIVKPEEPTKGSMAAIALEGGSKVEDIDDWLTTLDE